MIIDLRSDTVTRPTPDMKSYMMDAEVGDDVFGEDPTVIALEKKIADTFGKKAALFCPSGTMTNQIALRINTEPQDEVICDQYAHIYRYEGGGAANNSLISLRLLQGESGRISAQQVQDNINPDDVHFPRTSLISLENTVNKGGGCYYQLSAIKSINDVAKRAGLKMHLDGARIFNALIETGENAADYGQYFNTISVCFSKGLGAPVGSAILGSVEAIKKARRVRKVFGGGMRQAGYLAAACIYALDHHIDRMSEDHRRARILSEIMNEKSFVTEVIPVHTNILIYKIDQSMDIDEHLTKLKTLGILAVPFGKHEVRLVTHLDFTDDMLQEFRLRLKNI